MERIARITLGAAGMVAALVGAETPKDGTRAIALELTAGEVVPALGMSAGRLTTLSFEDT